MVLLALIALAILSLSTIEVRQTRQANHMAEAQANARMALMLAIGDLQKYAGPDQRVTAAAAIRGATTNKHWTGVWSTTTLDTPESPMVGGHENALYFTDKRSQESSLNNHKWKDSLHLKWLVSGEQGAPDFNGDAVTLVASGSIGQNPANDDQVSVPLVSMSQGAQTGAGSFAYWVSDESQKIRVDLAPPTDNEPNKNAPTDGGYYRLAGAESPGLGQVKSGSNTPYQPIDDLINEDRQKIITGNTIGLALSDPALQTAAKKNFHDFTTKSLGVLANVRSGGLMKDLTDYLQASAGIPAVAGISGTAMSADKPILPGDEYKELGPNYLHFRNWHKLSDELSSSSLNQRSIAPQFIPARGDWGGNYSEGQTSDISKKAQPVQPVMTNCRVAFDFSRDSSRGNARGIRIHLYPRVTLWNPYNVTLTGARYIVACPIPQVNNLRVNGQALINIPGDPNSGKMWGPLTGSLLYFVTEPIDMKPGECLVFSPNYSASGTPRIGGNSARYDTSNVSSNVLSAKIPTGQNNFYIDSGKAAPASINLNASTIRYGIPWNVNFAFTNRALYFMLKRTTSSSGALTISNALNSPSISSILMEPAGKSRYGWWFVYGENTHPVNNARLPGFATYNSSPNRNPPRLWFIQGRTRWMDEFDEMQSLGQQWGKGSGLLYHNPVIGNFNVRSPYIHRSPYCYYNDWTRWAPGPSMLPWATPRLGDARNQLPYRDGKSYGSPFGLPSEWGAIKSYALFDLPNKDIPVFSLASLQHAQLGFQGWQPTYIVGHSNAEPRSDRDASVSRQFYADTASGAAWGGRLAKNGRSGNWSSMLGQQINDLHCYDITYSVNQMLWDRYYLSTIPDTSGWDPLSDRIPNSRLVIAHPPSVTESDVKGYLSAGNSFNYASYVLMNKGAFNVNSTSVEAWRSLFSMLGKIPRPDASGGESHHAFSRLLLPRISQSTGGGGNTSQTKNAAAWEGVRTLTEAEIDQLATHMVEIVKARGPFLSLSDFVNRRLGQSQSSTAVSFDDETFCGPLQAAIEKAGLNKTLQQHGSGGIPVDETRTDIGGANTGGGMRPDTSSYFPYKTYGAPGYLTQADVLQTIAPGLTARGDTFVIRAYGESRDSNGNVLAKAWCEATVQRTQDYLMANSPDSPSSADGNNPLEPVTIMSDSSLTLTPNGNLLPLNATFGRRFKVIDFRWLNKTEI